MTHVTIDNRPYDLDTLSRKAKDHIESIQFVDAELARLQGQIAVLKTARMAYIKALKDELPSPLAGARLTLN